MLPRPVSTHVLNRFAPKLLPEVPYRPHVCATAASDRHDRESVRHKVRQLLFR